MKLVITAIAAALVLFMAVPNVAYAKNPGPPTGELVGIFNMVQTSRMHLDFVVNGVPQEKVHPPNPITPAETLGMIISEADSIVTIASDVDPDGLEDTKKLRGQLNGILNKLVSVQIKLDSLANPEQAPGPPDTPRQNPGPPVIMLQQISDTSSSISQLAAQLADNPAIDG